MTHIFDILERIFKDLENGRNLKFKDKAEALAEKVKKEITDKVGNVKPRFDGWNWYFSHVHTYIDHSNKWHSKLISREVYEEIIQLEKEIENAK